MKSARPSLLLLLLPVFASFLAGGVVSAFASSSPPPPPSPVNLKSILVTGANKGQGLALCERILSERDDCRVFLCSRDLARGEEAAASLRERFLPPPSSSVGNDDVSSINGNAVSRVEVIQLDVTSPTSVTAAVTRVRSLLGPKGRLHGIVSNAGVLWGYPLHELMEVCATGVRRVLDGFLPLVADNGRVVVVTSGLGPLLHGYASEERQKAMTDDSSSLAMFWDGHIEPMIDECLQTYDATSDDLQGRIEAFTRIGFPGGPFAESAPDFHMYGLAKMFGDAYMLALSRKVGLERGEGIKINSVDPGLVYTDLILKMPRYDGKDIGETGAQTPHEGVEGAMRLLFEEDVETGRFYAMSKDELLHSFIDKRPN